MSRRLLLRDLEPGRLYKVSVRSTANGVSSQWGQVIDVLTNSDVSAPKAPTALSWTVSGTSFKATWTAPTQSEDNTALADFRDYQVTIYQTTVPATKAVYYTNAERFDFTLEANVAAFSAAKPNLTIEVRGRDNTGNISQTAVTAAAANPIPAIPANLTGAALQDSVSLKWDAVADTDLREYRVYNGTTLAGATTVIFRGMATAFVHNTTSYSTDQYYKVTAVDVFGQEGSAASVGPLRPKSPFTVDTIAPAVPTGLAATLTNATDGKTASAAVSWTAVTDTDGDLSEYIVGYKPSAATDWQYVKVDYTNTTVRIDNLLPYANYDFRIRSSDWAANLSAWSSTVTKTATANTAPATVTGVAITGGKDSVVVSWTANTETDVANGAGTYMVDIATNSGFTTGLLSYKTGANNITVSGLAQGTIYYARVKAVDSLGLSSASWSTTVNATTGTLNNFKYSTQAAAPTSPSAGDIWMDTTSGFEKQWNGSAWVLTGNVSITYITAKATDLVTNGNGTLKSNYNFSWATFTPTDTPTGTVGSFDAGTVQAGRWIDELISFDPTKKYKFSFQAKQAVSGATNRMYGFIAPFDAMGLSIAPYQYMYQPNTTTTLAQPLNNGDTVVYLTSAANWYGSASKPAGGSTHFRSMIFWNYVDGNGKTWPPFTYSRFTWKSDTWADGAVDTTANTITLNAPWSGGNFPAGHPLSNGSSGGSYVYATAISNILVPETWTKYTDTFSSGIMADTDAVTGRPSSAVWGTGLPPGTASIKVGWLMNYPPSPSNAIVGRHMIAGVSFSDASAAQATADAAVKTYVNEYAVNSSETVAPTTGWSTATPTRTAGTFVWFRTTVTRADGTTSTTNPALLTGNTGATGSQGIQGPKGADGTSLYTWIKYADTPTTGMADSPTGKTYMGIAYNKTSATESSVYTDYDWSLIKGADGATGAQGVQGPAGADGQPTYTWIKYGTSSTGAGLSDDPTGKTYIGIAYNKTTATESTVATDYEWSLIQGPQGPTGATGATGPAGTPAATVSLTATAQVLASPSGGGATTPATSTVTGAAVNTTITAWTYSVDGAAFSATVPAGVSRTGNVVTITGSTMTARTIAVKMADANGVSDTLTVAKAFDGATGAQGPTGATGGTGATGPAGAAGADAYTVVLTNEAQVFPGSTNAALAGTATTAVVAYKGTTQIAATIGTITGQVTGLTTAITNNGTNTATVTVTVTTALTTQSGTLTIPITVDGKAFTKTFAWSVSYTGATGSQGPTGNTGATGATGVGITSVTPYFAQVTTGAAAPAKPTTATPAAPWVATEPDYVVNTELYRTEKVLYTDASFAYTNVSKVSSYAAAVSAYATANGKNKIVRSTSAASGTTGYVAGDLWWQIDGSGNVIGQWKYSGSAWVAESITSSVITNLDVNKLTAGSGFITTLNIAAGGAIQSAGYTSGGTTGFQLSNSGLTIKGSGNTVDAGVLKGGIITGTTINVGAGGTLNVDSTGVIKSNNYAAGSTGYKLSNTGLEINDGTIDAKALKTGSAIITDLVIGQSANSLGSLKSYGYVAGTTGFKLDKTGLEINNGVISAAALQLQTGHNMMLPAYADFEFGDYYYINAFWTPRGQGKIAINGGLAASNVADASNKAVTGTSYLGVGNLGAANAVDAWFGTTTTDYNIKVDPGQKYIISGYFLNASSANSQWNLVVKGSDGSTLVTYPINLGGGVSQTTYTRVWTTVTIPASGVSSVLVGVTNTDTTVAKDLHIDAMQFEPITGGMTTPSVWKPPAQTTIDASGITTGMMRSNNNVTVSGTDVPAWSLNKDGNIQVGDALVRGKLIIGTGTEALPNRAPGNGNFESDVNGYQVYQAGATGTAIARTTTAGEVISGAGSAKVTAAAGNKTDLGVSFSTPQTYLAGTTITVSANVKVDAGGGSLLIALWDSSSQVVDSQAPIVGPVAGSVYPISATFTVPSGRDGAKVVIWQGSGTLTTTSFIVDDIVMTANNEIGSSYVQSANFISGDGGAGWRIDGQGNVEFNQGYFRGELGAGTVTTDTLSSTITMSSTFRTADTGRRVEFNGDGITAYRSDNSIMVQLPTDGSKAASFDGDLLASSLTISDQMAIRGTNNELSRGATLTLQSGTTAPTSPPQVTVDWNTITLPADGTFDPYRYGITVQGGWFRIPVVVYGSGTYIESYDMVTGAKQWGSLNTSANDGMYNGLGGITSIGNNVYLLGQNAAGAWRLMGFTFSTAVSGTPTRLFNVAYPQGSDHRRPALGNDGTNLIVTFTNVSSNLAQYWTFSATTGARIGTGNATSSNVSFSSDMASINKGVFDNGFGQAGGTCFVVTSRNHTTAWVFNNSFQKIDQYNFPLIAKPAGQCYANGKFYTYDSIGHRIIEHTSLSWNESIAGQSTWYAANTWYNTDATNGSKETTMGPIKSFTMKQRARVTVTSPPLPIRPVPNTVDDATAAGVYMARGVSTPTRLLMERQAYLADGVRSVIYDTSNPATLPAAGANAVNPPPVSSNYPASSPAVLRSDNDRFTLNGDGSGQWGSLSVDSSGNTTLAGSAWTQVTPINSWVNYGGGHQTCAYRKVGDIVYIRGLVKGGTASGTSTGNVFVLPVGMRPSAQEIWTVLASNSVVGDGRARVDVFTDGSVRVVAMGTNSTTAYLSLAGIAFAVN